MDNIDTLRRQIEVARGLRPADLLLKGGKVVNVFSGEVQQTNVAICNGRIAGVGDYYHDGIEVCDAGGLFLIPGLIDAHVHIESSMHMGIYKTWNKIETSDIADFYTILIIVTNTSNSIITYSHICLIHFP